MLFCACSLSRLLFPSILLVSLILALPAPAQAENLRVSLLLAPGQDLVGFTLTTEDSATFRKKWGALASGSLLIPVGDGTGYHGVVLRGDKDDEFRLFNGVARLSGRFAPLSRTDDLRMLERWVLTRAPPPLGPALVRALDEAVGKRTDGMVFPETHNRSAASMIDGCQTESKGDTALRLSCLHRALLGKMDHQIHLKALEDLLRKTDPQPE